MRELFELEKEVIYAPQKVQIILRPSGFAKLVFLNQLVDFFSITPKDQSSSTTPPEIPQSIRRYYHSFPVIYLNFAFFTGKNFEEALLCIRLKLIRVLNELAMTKSEFEAMASEFPGLKKIKSFNKALKPFEMELSLAYIMDALVSYSKKRIILIINSHEYPVVLAQKNNYESRMKLFLKNFYTHALTHPKLVKGILFGIHPILKEIFYGSFINYDQLVNPSSYFKKSMGLLSGSPEILEKGINFIAYIIDDEHKAKFFIYPPGSGKTYNLLLTKLFFSSNKEQENLDHQYQLKDIFIDTMYKHPRFTYYLEYFRNHPVIYLNFEDCPAIMNEGLKFIRQQLIRIIEQVPFQIPNYHMEIWSLVSPEKEVHELDLSFALRSLLWLYHRHFKNKVIFIIDNYDFIEKEKVLSKKEMQEFLLSFYYKILYENEDLEKALFTGTTPLLKNELMHFFSAQFYDPHHDSVFTHCFSSYVKELSEPKKEKVESKIKSSPTFWNTRSITRDEYLRITGLQTPVSNNFGPVR